MSLFGPKNKLTGLQASLLISDLIFLQKHGGSIASHLQQISESRVGREAELLLEMSEALRNGEDIGEIFSTFGVVNDQAKVVLQGGIDVAKVLPMLQRLKTDETPLWWLILRCSMKPLLIALTIGSLIPIFSSQIYELFGRAKNLAQAMNKTALDLPVYLQDPYYLLKIDIKVIAVLVIVLVGFELLYKYGTEIYYQIFGWRKYQDWTLILSMLSALKEANASNYSALKHLSGHAPNVAIENLLFEAATEIYQNGKNISEALNDSSLVPPEVISCFRSGDLTHEHIANLNKARDYCQKSVDESRKKLTEGTEIVAGAFTQLTVGILVMFVSVDLMEAFLVPMLSVMAG